MRKKNSEINQITLISKRQSIDIQIRMMTHIIAMSIQHLHKLRTEHHDFEDMDTNLRIHKLQLRLHASISTYSNQLQELENVSKCINYLMNVVHLKDYDILTNDELKSTITYMLWCMNSKTFLSPEVHMKLSSDRNTNIYTLRRMVKELLTKTRSKVLKYPNYLDIYGK